MGQLGHRNSKNVSKPKLVEDFGEKKIKLIAAGLNHSVVCTQEGDVYVCGHNKDGQLGLGDTGTRTGFTLLESMQEKNVYRIFAGGNHTWVLLDQFVPLRAIHRYPSPLKGTEEVKS
jgi:alpha-tubulin suppressor-like RCC1 family protein